MTDSTTRPPRNAANPYRKGPMVNAWQRGFDAGRAEAAAPDAGLRERLARAYEPDRSPQWRSGYLYAESIALGVSREEAE